MSQSSQSYRQHVNILWTDSLVGLTDAQALQLAALRKGWDHIDFFSLSASIFFFYLSLRQKRSEKRREGRRRKTRPDTRPPVADGWAGAEMQLSTTKNVLKRLFSHFSNCTDGPTDGRTDGWTDKASYRVACPRLKRKGKETRWRRWRTGGKMKWKNKENK